LGQFTGRSKKRRMPIAARQMAKSRSVPPMISGSSDSVITTRSIASAAPIAATNAEPAQNRAASKEG